MLGRGGMGTVYLARHTMMNRPVALKAISKQLEKIPVAIGAVPRRSPGNRRS